MATAHLNKHKTRLSHAEQTLEGNSLDKQNLLSSIKSGDIQVKTEERIVSEIKSSLSKLVQLETPLDLKRQAQINKDI